MRFALAGIAVAVLLAGCGGEGGNDDMTHTVTQAAQRTDYGGPVLVHQTVTLHTGPNEDVNIKGEGSADGKRRLSRYELHAESNTTPVPDKVAQQLAFLNGKIAERGEIIYLNMPFLNRELGLRDRWIKLDPSDPSSRKLGFTGTTGLGAVDPALPVDAVRAARNVKKVGNEADGTHYRITIDYDRYLDVIGPQAAASLRPGLEKLKKALHTARHPADVWIDTAGRITRLDGKLQIQPSGTEVASYRFDIERALNLPAMPRHALSFKDVIKE